MAKFEVPDDMAEFLAEWAPKLDKADAQALLLHLIDQFRTLKGPRPEYVAARSAGVKGSEEWL